MRLLKGIGLTFLFLKVCASSYAGEKIFFIGQTLARTKTVTEEEIKELLKEEQQEYPQLYQDALRVWGKFKRGKSDPNYTYRAWGRNLILRLREKTGAPFDTKEHVEKVFNFLCKTKKISEDAAALLTQDVWSFLQYRDGRKEKAESTPLQAIDQFKGEQEI